MAVSLTNIAPQRIQPFMRRDGADPVGQMYGHARTTGDATGGFHLIQFRLPENNVYLIRFVRIGTTGASNIFFDVSIGLGIVMDGATMAWRRTGIIVSDTGSTNEVFEPDRLMILPDERPAISGQIVNVDTRVFTFQFQAVFWTRQAFIDMPSEKFSRFL